MRDNTRTVQQALSEREVKTPPETKLKQLNNFNH